MPGHHLTCSPPCLLTTSPSQLITSLPAPLLAWSPPRLLTSLSAHLRACQPRHHLAWSPAHILACSPAHFSFRVNSTSLSSAPTSLRLHACLQHHYILWTDIPRAHFLVRQHHKPTRGLTSFPSSASARVGMRTTSNSCAPPETHAHHRSPPETHAHHQNFMRTTRNSCAPHIVSNSCVPPTTRAHQYRSCPSSTSTSLDLLGSGLLTLGLSFRFTLLAPRLSSQQPCFRHGSALTQLRLTWFCKSTLSLLSFSP